MTEGLVSLDRAWRCHYLNAQAEALLELPRQLLLGESLWAALPEATETELYAKLHHAVASQQQESVDVFYAPLYRWLRLRLFPSPRGLTVLMSDVTDAHQSQGVRGQVEDRLETLVADRTAELEALNKQLRQDALYDALTGLPNRTAFLDELEQALGQYRAQQDGDFAVLLLACDRFKVINDSLGYDVGDALLVALTQRLQTALRLDDSVARIGGDEFALLAHCTNSRDARFLAARILTLLSRPFFLEGHEIHLSTSMGVVADHRGYHEAQDILRDADLAAHRAKELGRARFEVANSELRERAISQMSLESELHAALEREELQLLYQPITAAAQGTLVGFEALLRWQHPQRGTISPATFIPLAEANGLIVEMDRWVILQACRQLASWQRAFPERAPLTVSVNISGKQFMTSDLGSYVQGVLAETGLEPAALNLEITETVIMAHAAQVLESVRHLRQLGVKLHIDDFGVGYSSLSYLQRFQADTLKIDRSFVDGLGKSGSSNDLVRAMITMARALNMEVIAEGVETKQQLDKLTKMGCRLMQGYYFAKPLSVNEAKRLMARADTMIAI